MRARALERLTVAAWLALVMVESARRRLVAVELGELWRRRSSEWWLYPAAAVVSVVVGLLVAQVTP